MGQGQGRGQQTKMVAETLAVDRSRREGHLVVGLVSRQGGWGTKKVTLDRGQEADLTYRRCRLERSKTTRVMIG